MSENKDINIFKHLIKNYDYNFDYENIILRGKVIDKSEKIIWKIVQKDFTRNLMLR